MSKIILFEPRSGSTYLSKFLCGPNDVNIGEYLNGMDGVLGGKYIPNSRENQFDRLCKMKNSYILKIAPSDYLYLDNRGKRFFKDKDVILLKRINKRRQILSFLYASATRIYHYYKDDIISKKIVTAKRKHYENLLVELINIDKVSKELNIVKELFYEDFSNNKKFLNDEFNIKRNDIALPVKSTLDLETCFNNIDEINTWIKKDWYENNYRFRA